MCYAYPERLVGTVLAFQDKHLETFPAERVEARDLLVHVFEEVILVHYRVDFELDGVLQAEFLERDQILNMSPFSTTDFDVGLFIKGVTGYGYDINIPSIFPHELRFD